MSNIDIKNFVNQYTFECTLPGSGKIVKFKPVTTGQMKQLLIYEKEESVSAIENMMDDLIRSCVVYDNFDVEELYLQDRFFLLVEIRKKTKGSSYTFGYECPVCGKENITTIDLDELTVKPFKTGEGVVEINDSLKASIRFPTRREQKRAMSFTDKKKYPTESYRSVETAMYIYASVMDKFFTPQGEVTDVSMDDKIFVLNGSTDKAFSNIEKWTDENEFGVDFTYSVECDCGFVRSTSIPITNFFT